MGEAARASRLLLAEDGAEAGALADEIEAANTERRGLTKTYLAEARLALGLGRPRVMSRTQDTRRSPAEPWSPPARPAQTGRPGLCVPRCSFGEIGPSGSSASLPADWPTRRAGPRLWPRQSIRKAGLLRASCRGPQSWSLAEALVACEDLLVRHGGHAAAAGFDIEADRWPEFERRFLRSCAAAPYRSGRAELILDIVMPATEVDYGLVRELEMLEPTGPAIQQRRWVSPV